LNPYQPPSSFDPSVPQNPAAHSGRASFAWISFVGGLSAFTFISFVIVGCSHIFFTGLYAYIYKGFGLGWFVYAALVFFGPAVYGFYEVFRWHRQKSPMIPPTLGTSILIITLLYQAVAAPSVIPARAVTQMRKDKGDWPQ
jgi:hypothetical protein